MPEYLLSNQEIIEKFREAFGTEKFIISLLVDAEGLVVDVIGEGYNPDVFSATVAIVQHCVDGIKRYIGVDDVDEIMFRLAQKKVKLIYRCFELEGMAYFLIFVCPLRTNYRRLSNELIRIIKKGYQIQK